MILSYEESIQNKRQTNEDSFLSFNLSGNYELCFVIDGCGASNNPGDVVNPHLLKITKMMEEINLQQLEALFVELNNYLFEYRKYSHVGCYVGTMAVIDSVNKTVLIAHVGDTRAYMLHDDALIKVTKDHSVIGEMEENGEITEAEAKCHPHRNMITRCCGKELHFAGDGFVFCNEVPFEEGDRLVIMTDGVYDTLCQSDVKGILAETPKPHACVEQLLKMAVERGSTDNATAAVFFF